MVNVSKTLVYSKSILKVVGARKKMRFYEQKPRLATVVHSLMLNI